MPKLVSTKCCSSLPANIKIQIPATIREKTMAQIKILTGKFSQMDEKNSDAPSSYQKLHHIYLPDDIHELNRTSTT